MEQWFVTPGGRLRDRWDVAFERARAVRQLSEVPANGANGTVWLEVDTKIEQWTQILQDAVATGYSVVVLSPVPDDASAARALSVGARAFCHSQSSPEKLREIQKVVSEGGVWLPDGLMKRLVSLSLQVMGEEPGPPADFGQLTPRERSVAEFVAEGCSNREVAEELGITERTVKAHLSAIFVKLDLRDRVQLALAVNNVVRHFR